MIAKLVIVAIRNMRRQLRRTILTALSFAVAVFLYTVLVAVPVSMDRIAADATRGLRLIVIAHNSYRLPAKYCNEIKKMPHAMACAPEIQWSAIYRDPRKPVMAMGVTEDIYSVTGSGDFQVTPEMRKELFTDRRDASVGSVLMREQGWKLGQPFTLRSPDNPKLTLTLIPKFELRTLLTARALFFDRRLFDEAVKNTYGADIQDRATFLAVKVDRAANMDSVIAEIDENFHNSEDQTETTEETAALNSVITGIGDIRTIMYSVCVVVLITILLIAANSMAMMVRDRISEVAIMRALGFSRVHVGCVVADRGGTDRTGRRNRRRSNGAVGVSWGNLARHAHRRIGIHGGSARHRHLGGAGRARREHIECDSSSGAGDAYRSSDSIQKGGVRGQAHPAGRQDSSARAVVTICDCELSVKLQGSTSKKA